MTERKKFRPVGITILAIFFLLFAAWNGLRLGETIFFWKTLEGYGGSPLYIALTGAFWLIVALILFWACLNGKAWGRLTAFGGTFGYTIWYWFDRLVLQKPHANWPFVLAVDIVFLLAVFLVLIAPNTRIFFQRDTHE